MLSDCNHKNCTSVLIADDNQDTLDLISYGAKSRGWCVDTAHHAREIVQKVNERCSHGDCCYSAIIADLHYFSNEESSLPRLSGVTAAKSIREEYKDIPIIFVTGFSTYLIKEEAEKYSNEIVQKPFDLEALLDRVEYYINIFTTPYEGIERRRKSLNLTKFNRRKSDKRVEINKALIGAIDEVREEKAHTTT